ncbi:uncharacterized protein EV154DRAFT_570079 [Mucor mucedo]|uniref:uncharacterized protein n=1 Tax=Mucor mucedo TaxID=29922 RepID=UPI00221F0388|nr:uncharacterized protein EV154DRAFT_570079 [Mucor mucedo]KAI7873462.1 hypothetical protein EV154DRAFT_570079 [Mucor mucedo]
MRSSIIFFIALATLMMTLVHAHTERSGTPQQSGLRIKKRGSPYGRGGPSRQSGQRAQGPSREVRPQGKPAAGGGGGGPLAILGGGGLPIVGNKQHVYMDESLDN